MNISIDIDDNVEIEWIKNNYDKLSTALSIGIKSLMMGGLKNDNINTIIEKSIEKEIKPINDKIDNIFNISNSYKKGVIGEKIPIEYLKKLYPYNEVIETTKIPHSGDCIMKIEQVGNILYEFKYYDNIVNKKEIDKFYYDLNYNKIKYGIFISHTSGIFGKKKQIEWEYYNDKIIIYISRLGINDISIQLSTNLLITLIENNNNKNLKIENNIYEKIFNDFIIEIKDISTNTNIIYDKILNIKKTFNSSIDSLIELLNQSNKKLEDILSKYNDYFLTNIEKDITYNNFIENIDKYYIDFVNKIINIKGITLIYKKNKIKIIKDDKHIIDILFKENILVKKYINSEDIISYDPRYEYIDNNISVNIHIDREKLYDSVYITLISNKI